MSKILAVVVISISGISANADETVSDPERQAQTISPFLGPQTIAVGYLRADGFAALWKQMAGVQGHESDVARISDWASAFKKAGGRELYLVLDLADLPVNAPELIVPLGPDQDPRKLIDLLQGPGKKSGEADDLPRPFYFQVCEKMNNVLFCGSRAARERARAGRPGAEPDLSQAFEALKRAPIGLLFVPSADTRRVLDEMIPLPAGVGGAGRRAATVGAASCGESGKIISQGLKWARWPFDRRRAPRSNSSFSRKMPSQRSGCHDSWRPPSRLCPSASRLRRWFPASTGCSIGWRPRCKVIAWSSRWMKRP